MYVNVTSIRITLGEMLLPKVYRLPKFLTKDIHIPKLANFDCAFISYHSGST